MIRIKFNDGTKKPCYSPTETMLFQDGKKAAWLFSFTIPASATEIDELLTLDNISNIVMEGDDESCGYSKSGYDTVHGVFVAYNELGGMAEVQLKRSISDEVDEE